ncbi:hypothetical protein [Sorangium sp. So ce128]|uniref:hypothetical protein n=1 Tax=Sorangium sp. So ce128 TaxID=3133281 RepID=UPI003F5D6DF2
MIAQSASPGQGDARSREAADGSRSGVSSPPMRDRQQVLRQTRARLHPERIARREGALVRARMPIEGALGQLDETGLRRLLQRFSPAPCSPSGKSIWRGRLALEKRLPWIAVEVRAVA